MEASKLSGRLEGWQIQAPDAPDASRTQGDEVMKHCVIGRHPDFARHAPILPDL